MNLIYTCVFYNEKYLILMKKLLESYYKSNKSSNDCFLIITSPNFYLKVDNICSSIGLNYDIWTIDICNYGTMIDNIYESTYSRYYIYEYPKIKKYNKIFYLDCDIIVINDLEPIMNLELNDRLYTLYEECDRLSHCSMENDEMYEILKKNKKTFTTAMILFNNNSKNLEYMKKLYLYIKNYHNEVKQPLKSFDQPIVNKLAIHDDMINNSILKEYCLNIGPKDGIETLQKMNKYLLCHFATSVGDDKSKIQRTTYAEQYLNH